MKVVSPSVSELASWKRQLCTDRGLHETPLDAPRPMHIQLVSSKASTLDLFGYGREALQEEMGMSQVERFQFGACQNSGISFVAICGARFADVGLVCALAAPSGRLE